MQCSIFPYSLKSGSQLRETVRELLNWTAHWPTQLLPSVLCFSYLHQIFSMWHHRKISSMTSYWHVFQITVFLCTFLLLIIVLFSTHQYKLNVKSMFYLLQCIICKGCICSLTTFLIPYFFLSFIFQRISLKSLNILYLDCRHL